jgi:hypothetical protein
LLSTGQGPGRRTGAKLPGVLDDPHRRLVCSTGSGGRGTKVAGMRTVPGCSRSHFSGHGSPWRTKMNRALMSSVSSAMVLDCDLLSGR